MKTTRVYEYGDLLIAATHHVPSHAQLMVSQTLFEQPCTGMRHRLLAGSGDRIFRLGSLLYLHIQSHQAQLIHDRLPPLELPHGLYRVWTQKDNSRRAAMAALEAC